MEPQIVRVNYHDKELILVPTAHVSKNSATLVRNIIEQEQPIHHNSVQNYIIAFNALNPTTVDEQYANEINNIFAEQLAIN